VEERRRGRPADGGEKMKILVADDDVTSRHLLGAVLATRGHEVIFACDGVEALEEALKPGSPDLVIFDRMMPGLDGLEVTRRCRAAQECGRKYVILLTVRDGKKDVVEGLSAGADDYIAKPFDREELLARVAVGERFTVLRRGLEDKVEELSLALGHIKKLQGLLPICMHCHKIRNDKESWQRIESYISDHAEVQFSHGICPDCEKKYYGEQGTGA